MRFDIAALLVVTILACSCVGQGETAFSSTDLAKCMSENGVKVYSAFWCEPCQTQKQLLGDGWEYVNYVECGMQGENDTFNQECVQAGVENIPT